MIRWSEAGPQALRSWALILDNCVPCAVGDAIFLHLSGSVARATNTTAIRCGCGHGAPLHAALTRDTALTARVRRGPAWCTGKTHPSTQPVAIPPNWAMGNATYKVPPRPRCPTAAEPTPLSCTQGPRGGPCPQQAQALATAAAQGRRWTVPTVTPAPWCGGARRAVAYLGSQKSRAKAAARRWRALDFCQPRPIATQRGGTLRRRTAARNAGRTKECGQKSTPRALF